MQLLKKEIPSGVSADSERNHCTKNEVSRGFAHICDALHDLVPFAEFKKREKHPWTVLI